MRLREKLLRSTIIGCSLALTLLHPASLAQQSSTPPETAIAATAAHTAGPAPQPTDLASRFGALEGFIDISLSPDGMQIAFIAPGAQLSRGLFVASVAEGSRPRRILTSSGNPDFLSSCDWVTNSRLTCQIYGRDSVAGTVLGVSSVIAVDTGTGAVRALNNHTSSNSLYADGRGGTVIDLLPQDNDAVLVIRSYVPEVSTGTHLSQSREGLGVDRLDLATGRASSVERANRLATDYITDGQGHVRIMEMRPWEENTGQLDPVVRFLTKLPGASNWTEFARYDFSTRAGFYPVRIDAASNSAIGFSRIDGRQAAVAMALDGSGTTRTLFAHPQVDVDEVMHIGRNRRIIGFSYVTDRRNAVIIDEQLRGRAGSISRALGGASVHFIDASADESRYLVWAGSDTSPGAVYLYAPRERQLRPLLASREAVEGLTISPMQSISYPAADGTQIPGYLTLPPGRSDMRGLPAIVMPHGGPSARDEWGFDWLSQYFAQMGYAVLQPNYRGSDGYGDAWLNDNGFRNWRTSIGDIADAGRWMVGQGADPAKLSIVGWSYGGYAALQSGVTTPGLFKAIVAIAPVTDIAQLRAEAEQNGERRIVEAMVGQGQMNEASPARNAAAITAPVMLFHGTFDQNVNVAQSRLMRDRLTAAGKNVTYQEYPNLAHSLGTAEARADMLRRIAGFLPH